MSAPPRLRIALIGHGAIGAAVRRILAGQASSRVEVIALLARPQSAQRLGVEAAGVRVHTTLDALLAEPVDLVAECAAHAVVREHGERVLAAGRDLLVSSVGALADDPLRAALVAAAERTGRQVIVPAGAIGALDLLRAATLAGLGRVVYRSRKPPAAWKGSPAEALVDLDRLTSATTFFEGSAREAASRYPKNANVAATVALATLGLDRTDVALVADPGVSANVHEIDADGPSGRVSLRTEGLPARENPRTSMITAYSVARAILDRRETLRIG